MQTFVQVIIIIFAAVAVLAFFQWCIERIFSNAKKKPKFSLRYIGTFFIGLVFLAVLSVFEIWQVIIAFIMLVLLIFVVNEFIMKRRKSKNK